ncbi:MAG: type II CRISPR RNA-guided endonuclease Cas9, partial [Planctomycetaceae bacterium]|nr:type II CRISPR RNA-guided endonuclease Cas9 [Planctomycetaceae bacterium]
EGVDRDQTGSEHPKNEQRRIARGMRRQIARRSRRKGVLRRALVECGLLPSEPEQQRDLDSLDPYDLRRRALEQKLVPHEIGRLLIHLNQRRGFLSNRKADRTRAKENSEMLAEISELEGKMGDQTLGQYFAVKRDANPLDRIRGKHTRRDMYLDEFEKIWETQRMFSPDLLTDELKYGRRGKLSYPREPEPLRKRKSNSLLREFGLHGILFFQRALYWPKSVVGRCELEPKQKRCQKADRAAQRFRLLHEVNNLRIIPQRGEPRDLKPDERARVIAYLAEKKERTFDELRDRKCLGLLEGDGFNLEAGDRRKLQGMPIDALLAHKDLFGKKWHTLAESEKTQIVRSLIEEDEETVRLKATTEWGCTTELVERLIDTDLGDGYMAYSREAIEKLLPHLERGLPLTSRDGKPSALSEAGYLRADQRVPNQRNDLPLVPDDIVNPLVRQALFEVRKVVNAIIREYGKPAAIHIELAREVKGTSFTRAKDSARMRERERLRDDAAEQIRAWPGGYKVSRDAIERYLLWKEQGEICIYSGKSISPQQLLGGEAEIDHILPESKSLDNSLANKVVAFRSENQRKGQRTPHEWLAETEPAKFEAILQRAAKLPIDIRNGKRLKLQQPTVELDHFLNRQLTDTAYITSKVLEYVRCLGCDIVASKGQCTAALRHWWGLDGVLRDDGLKLKNREDHRHHAVDALVIALTNRKRLQELARVRGTDQQLAPPWNSFRYDTQQLVNTILVSHRVARKVSGALHEETLYGPTSKPHRGTDAERPHASGWIEKEKEFVYRKPLESLTVAMIEDIRDPQVKSLVIARLKAKGIDPATAKKIPKEVWTEPLLMTRKVGRTSSQPNVVKKVRLLKRDQTIRPIRQGTVCVKPGNTHHIALFDLPSSTPTKPKRDLVAVSMIDAIERVKRKQPVVERTHPKIPAAKFLMSLSQNEMILLKHNGTEMLCRFETAAATSQQMWFRLHTFAGMSADKRSQVSKKPSTFEGVKVTVDVLGRIRRASD